MLCLGFVTVLYIIGLIFPPWFFSAGAAGIPDGTYVFAIGTLEKIESKSYSTNLYLKNISWEEKKNKDNGGTLNGLIAVLSDSFQAEGLRIGSEICVSGEFNRFERAQNAGNFDAYKYYAIRRIDGRLKKARVEGTSDSYSIVRDRLFRLKERTKQVFYSYLDEETAGTMSALILGDKSGLDPDIKESYSNAGIAHILSLSGLHIATLGLLLVTLLKRSGLSMRVSSVISGLIMLLYSIMTGLSSSTVRAFIMFVLGIISISIRRTYDLLSGAALSAVLILMENPFYLYDSGFLLSFSAIMGISLINPMLMDISAHYLSRSHLRGLHNSKSKAVSALSYIFESILFSLSIEFATLPVMEASFYQLPRYGILLNIVVIPLMSGVLAAGTALAVAGNLASVLYKIGTIRVLFNFISSVSAKAAYVILRFYGILTEGVNSMDSNLFICGKPEGLQIAVYCLIMIFTLFLHTLLHGFMEKEKTGESHRKGKDGEEGMPERPNLYRNKRIVKRKIALFNSLPLIALLAVFVLSYRDNALVEFHAISVGQGDSMLIYGKETPVLLVDGGASDIKNTGKYRIIPCLKAHGISKIDYVFISHFDADHVNGITELLADTDSGIYIERIIISSCVPLIEENANFKAMLEAAAANKRGGRDGGVPVLLMDAGDVIEDKGIRLSCLVPDVKGDDAFLRRDINDNSMVLHFLHKGTGFSALFTGDMSREVEAGLIEDFRSKKEKALPLGEPVTLLKAAHHGSKTGSSQDFVRLLSPRITTISCGRDNSYGHPHKEAMDSLEAVPGNNIFITSECGEITIKVYKDRVSASGFL